jgi:hypothetical protein
MRSPLPAVAALLGLAARAGAAEPGAVLREEDFVLGSDGEAVAVLQAGCSGCDWGRRGREGAVLTLAVDGRYAQHLVLTRGQTPADYRAALGPLRAGRHRLRVSLDPAFTTASRFEVDILRVHVLNVAEDTPARLALSLSPILHARPGTLESKSDLPLLMWYESAPTARGTKLSYSVVFSNEDGGTPADRLMATWGRVTDIEYVYGVEVDKAGSVLAEEYQGREHKILPFRGRREGRHPLLYVVTDNNMVADTGTSRERLAPVPVELALDGVSREVVMDLNPWTYQVSFAEVAREGRVEAGARPGSGKLPDPRRFLFLEACGELHDATLAFDVGFDPGGGTTAWHASDGGLEKARIARSGCFRGAVAVPPGAAVAFQGVRFRAYPRPPSEGAPAPASASARVFQVNRLFALDGSLVPAGDLLERWSGELVVPADGTPVPVPREPGASR